MLNNHTVLAIVPARAGSKGIPGKNIKPLAGRPLIGWTLDCARRCPQIDRVVVSTDGREIADTARCLGGEVVDRPAELASDTALPKDAVRQVATTLAAQGARYDILVLLQPTSPLRAPEDIANALERLVNGGFDSIASAVAAKPHPAQCWQVGADGAAQSFLPGVDPWKPRQAMAPALALNGAVYAVWLERFLAEPGHGFLFGRYSLFEMPSERSVDIDTPLDLALAELLLGPRSSLL
jgi:CMP-N-acetylneuraminic acid synthetase